MMCFALGALLLDGSASGILSAAPVAQAAPKSEVERTMPADQDVASVDRGEGGLELEGGSSDLEATIPAGEETLPEPSDTRIQQVEYRRDKVFTIDVPVGYQLTVELASDDPILNIAVGDPGSFQATVTKTGDRLYVQALRGGANTNMTVVTANRRYAFDLTSGSGISAHIVRFHYASSEPKSNVQKKEAVARYKVTGARELQPDTMSDDGVRTSISWRADALLPAVFSVDRAGDERVVTGFMRGGFYVIDSIFDQLIFRIDSRRARARRVVTERGN